jgi:phage portal protein BeeE
MNRDIMSSSAIKSLTQFGLARRGTNWKDLRPRSPKSMGDMSGVILSRIGANNGFGVQDFSHESMARVYLCNDMAWTCINLVSSTVAAGQLKVRINDGKTVKYVPDHPLQKLLDFPNSSMTQFDLLQAYTTHQLLFGTTGSLLLRADMLKTCPVCLSEGNDDCLHKLWINTTGPIEQIMPVHPSTILEDWAVIDGKKQRVLFYTPTADKKYPIHPNNILTDPLYNTEQSWYGVSPTYTLLRWLGLDESMTNQIRQRFDNASIPSMIINMKPGNNYTYEQEPETLMQMMKEKWMAQFSDRGKGPKSPAFVYGDVSVERLQDKIEDSISKGIYEEIQNHVCATYGVPPNLYELGIKYSAKGAAAGQPEKDFYNRTISKTLARIKHKINRVIAPQFGTPGLEVDWDLSDMGIADFIKEAKQTAIKKDWELGLISRDTARVLLGYDPVGGELGDDFYRLSVMSDGSNTSQAEGMDNRLKVPASDGTAGHLTHK